MYTSEKRRIALSTVRAQARKQQLNPLTLSADDALRVLDDLARSEPQLIASKWYSTATDAQIKLFKRVDKKGGQRMTGHTDQRDQLFNLAKGVNDATFHLMVAQHKLYAALGTVEPLDPLINEMSFTYSALHDRVRLSPHAVARSHHLGVNEALHTRDEPTASKRGSRFSRRQVDTSA